MKKNLFVGIMLLFSAGLYAQTNTDTARISIQKTAEAMGHGGNNEIKINLLFAVAALPEISYERLLEDNMGVGLSVFTGVDSSSDYKFGFIPHYRLYFGQKKAAGFFIEGNAGVLGMKDHRVYYDYMGYPYNSSAKTYTRFGLGAAAGGKFLTRNGFLGEAYLGVGRIFGQNNFYGDEAYPRVGITIGKRF